VEKKAFMEIDLMLQFLCHWSSESEGAAEWGTGKHLSQLGCLSSRRSSFRSSLRIITHVEPRGTCPASTASFQWLSATGLIHIFTWNSALTSCFLSGHFLFLMDL